MTGSNMMCLFWLLITVSAARVTAQPSGGSMGPGMMGSAGPGMQGGMSYMMAFQALLNAHQRIERTVAPTDTGIRAETWSEDRDVARLIQQHVQEMKELMAGCGAGACPAQPRWWDPVFAAVYDNADRIQMEVTMTDKGVQVVESGDEGFAKKVIRAHADVVTKFVQNGHAEAMKVHEVR